MVGSTPLIDSEVPARNPPRVAVLLDALQHRPPALRLHLQIEVQVAQLPVLGLAGGLTHGVDPLGHLAPLLGGGKGLELERAHFEPGVYAEVVGRNGCGDEPGRGRLEGDGPDLDPADDLVFQALIIDLYVVVGGEVPLGIVIDSEMDSLADNASRPDVYLVIQPGSFEPAAAPRVRILKQRR